MTEKTQVELTLLLPGGNGCEPCRQRLQDRLQAHRGVEVTHVDGGGDAPLLCIHYDPDLISPQGVRAIAENEGAQLEARYGHETLVIQGLDCADCAQTLERAIQRLPGVLWVSVNFAASTLALEYDIEQVERPAIVGRIRALGYEIDEPAPAREMVFRVEGMDCADCALHLEEALSHTPGIARVSVDFTLARARITPQAGQDIGAVAAQVADKMGYALVGEGARGEGATQSPVGWRQRLWQRRRDLTTVGAGLLIALAFGLQLLGGPRSLVAGGYVAAILVGGFYIARAGWMAVRTTHSLDMNALMTIAAVGAVFIGEWAEGAVAMFLFSLGNTLEAYTMDRARNAIRSLMDLKPRTAIRLQGDQEQEVAVEDLRVGDRILVRPGERIPLDGHVLTGESAVNQAPITGESVPVDKSPGHEVFAGTVNGHGALTVAVTRISTDTTIARIIQMVEEAQSQKAPSQRFVDRFARVYTPLVIAVAAGVAVVPPVAGALLGLGEWGALFGEWVYRALVLLVIACPCALVISTPVSIVSAIASAARSGVLIKGGAYLEGLGSLKAIAFDKTGTLTVGRPQVVDMRCVHHPEGLAWTECPDCRQMLARAVAVERRSEHPLAQAVVRAAQELGVDSLLPAAEAVEALTGRGVRGKVNGHTLTVGTHGFVHEEHPELAEGPFCDAVHAAQAAGQSVMVVQEDGHGVLGFIAVSDALRPGVAGVMADLAQVGIAHTVMLTGDNQATARSIAAAAQVGEVRADLLPQDKVQAIESLLADYQSVAMVGDGVNDAPAMARATVGIAMGAAGTDTALETADVALMADDLSKLAFTVRLSKRARAIIRQNVIFALGIKAIFFALALAGIATLWMAVFADVGASMIVTFNGMRLLREKG